MESQLTQLLDEMGASWRSGERALAEEFLARHPHVANDREAAVRVIYEEICLREEQGEGMPSVEVMGRFPEFRKELEVLLGCHRLFQDEVKPTRYPEVGETLGDFALLAELGRGAAGRVFLARETTLADRPVVLKTTAKTGHEHLSLARLQHTHIVPLFTVQDFDDRNLRVLCMPSLGGTTLAALLAVRTIPLEKRRGQDLLDVLDKLGAGMPVAFERRGPARDTLAGLDYVEAIVWLGVKLAEALQYAHERGLVHLDIKPTNVLLAADAQPMLLDFHLAQPPLVPGEMPQSIGGTYDFMSPEQRAALDVVRVSRPIEKTVDGRSDVYSLGLVLYEALGGQVPINPDVPLPALSNINRRVSIGLSDIVCKMVMPEAEDRYRTAGETAADLRRHLEHLPLRGVANRSFGERYRKWRKRRPYALALTALAGALLLAFGMIGAVAWAKELDARRQSDAAWQRGNMLMAEARYKDAAASFGQARSLTNGWLGDSDMRRAFINAEDRARRADRIQELHTLADHMRFAFAIGHVPAVQLQGFDGVCRAVWERREELLPADSAAPETTLERTLREDFFDLALWWGEVQIRRAAPEDAATARARAIELLDEVGIRYGATAALVVERGRLRGERPHPDVGMIANGTPGSWEHWSLGRALMNAGELDRAYAVLRTAESVQEEIQRRNPLNRQTADFWATFYRGLCEYRRGRYTEAAFAFLQAPATPERHYFVGLTRMALKQYDGALEDLNRAVKQSGFAEAFLERGVLRCRRDEPRLALPDLARALELGANPGRAHYYTAVAQLALGEREAARVSVQKALETNPAYPEAEALARQLAMKKSK
jgi:serine/threonine protein kinase